MIVKLLKYEINNLKSEKYILEADENRHEIRIKAYKFCTMSNTYLLRGVIMNIYKDQSGFKTTEEFRKIDQNLKIKLVDLACRFCNLNIVIGGEKNDSNFKNSYGNNTAARLYK